MALLSPCLSQYNLKAVRGVPPLEDGVAHETLIRASLCETIARVVGAPGIMAEMSEVSEESGEMPTTFTDLMANL